jgi:hypothetical protein
MTGAGRAGASRAPATRAFFLRPAPLVSFCMIGREAVFLDLRRDRYFRIGGLARDALDRLIADPAGLASDEAERLRRTGLFVETSTASEVGPTEAAEIRTSLVEEATARRSRVGLLPELVARLAMTRLALRRGRLPRLVDEARYARAILPATRPTTQELTRDWIALRPLVPFAPNCLLDSFSLAAFLRARGAAPGIVFGVKLDPFGAHCWVQHEDIVLNDSVGNAADFTPILVV